jgi:asparagine synthase (glutamine-hydrolysing)
MGLVDRGVYRGEFVEQLFNKQLQEHPGYYGEMIWISMMLEQWLLNHRTNYSI